MVYKSIVHVYVCMCVCVGGGGGVGTIDPSLSEYKVA